MVVLKNLLKPDATMLAGLIVGLFVVPHLFAIYHSRHL